MSFYVTGGSLQSDAPSYVEREADQSLLDCLLEGEFCYVLTARQMGKSSLMVRTASRLRTVGIQVAALDLTAIGGQNVTPDQWYHGLLDTLGQELDLEDELEVFWHANAHLGALHRLMKALRQIVLGRLESGLIDGRDRAGNRGIPESTPSSVRSSVRLVIFVDEIDFVRSLPFGADEFFAAIRECYNHRSLDPGFQRLTFCLLGVASPSDLIRDTRTTPFNIGRRIELNDFTPEEAAPLAQGLPLQNSPLAANHEPAQLLARILYWTEGHPYLTQKLCRVTAEALQRKERFAEFAKMGSAELVDQVCGELFLSHRARERDDNLVFVRERLLRNETGRADLLEFYLKIWRGRRVLDDELDPLVTVLRLSGVVRVSDGLLRERNLIYGRVFDGEWVRANMPEADLRRQRQAYRRGAIWATAVSTVILAIMAWLVVTAWNESQSQQLASAQAHFAQAQTKRVSGRAGQRLESLRALTRAQAHYPDRAELRNEMIACLALVDLEKVPLAVQVPADAMAVAANQDLTHRAVADRKGRIRILGFGSNSALGEVEVETGPVVWMALSPNARHLAVQYGLPRRLTVWDWAQLKPLVHLTNEVAPRAIDFSPDGGQVAVGLQNGTVTIYSLTEGKTIPPLSCPTSTQESRKPVCVRYSPLGDRVAEGSSNSSQVVIYDLHNPESPLLLRSHRSPASILSWHPDGRQLAVASEYRDIYVWDLKLLKFSELTQAHSDTIYDLTFNRQGDLLATAGGDMTLKLWTLATDRPVSLDLEGEAQGRLHFSPSDHYLTHVSPVGAVQRWRVRNPEEYRVFRPATGSRVDWTRLCFSGDGRLLMVTSSAGLRLSDAATGAELGSIPLKACEAGFMDPVRGHLYASTAFGFYRWPNLNKPGDPNVQFGPPDCFNLPAGISASAFSSGSRLASILHGDHVHVADLDNPLSSHSLPVRGQFKSIALNSSGDWLGAWSERSNKLSLWQLKKNPVEAHRVRELDSNQHYAFTPDGQWILTSWNKQYQCINLKTWRSYALPAISSRPGFQSGSLALSSAGRTRRILLALTMQPTLIKVFELELGNENFCLERAALQSPDRQAIAALSFSPDGSRLAAATLDQTVEVWDLAQITTALTELKTESPFPPAAARSEQPPTVGIEPGRVDTESPRRWQDVERYTVALADSSGGRPSSEMASNLTSRGQVLLQLRQYVQAKADFREALRLKPNDPEAEDWLRLAETLALLQSPAQVPDHAYAKP